MEVLVFGQIVEDWVKNILSNDFLTVGNAYPHKFL